MSPRVHVRVQKFEEALRDEVGNLDTYQVWVKTQSACAKQLETALAEADAEYATIVSELAGRARKDGVCEDGDCERRAAGGKVPLTDVADDKSDSTALIDTDGFSKIGGEFGITREHVKHLEERREQLRINMQAATKDKFREAMAKVGSIKAELEKASHQEASQYEYTTERNEA
ncbi:unnamed protein product, partial [Prorocentrum cordatum]